jgi:hypothetical protein
MGLYLSPKHGVNSSIEKCFFCNGDKGVILFGRLRDDAEAPRAVVINYEPCDTCKGYMQQGIILISVDEKKTDDMKNPWRSGGWVVVKDALIERAVSSVELRDDILKKRVAFLPDEVWDRFGLPRGTDVPA